MDKKIVTSYRVYESVAVLTDQNQLLMQAATKAIHNAYAPYSQFNVGAAVLLENGEIVTGNNQENAAYPSGMCAERVAVWNAMSHYPEQKIKKVAIIAQSPLRTVNKPVAPCGACRQVLMEYESKQQEPISVFFSCENGPVIEVNSLKDLLPFAFDQSFL
ncbi:MAG: cytidine deaminase [Flavobacteriia bacterium]|nr:MAG: cytidine deaminase [Flavobacteriia bacterium]